MCALRNDTAKELRRNYESLPWVKSSSDGMVSSGAGDSCESREGDTDDVAEGCCQLTEWWATLCRGMHVCWRFVGGCWQLAMRVP
jgi:hypothetical protein